MVMLTFIININNNRIQIVVPHLYGNGVSGGVPLDSVHHNVRLGVGVFPCSTTATPRT